MHCLSRPHGWAKLCTSALHSRFHLEVKIVVALVEKSHFVLILTHVQLGVVHACRRHDIETFSTLLGEVNPAVNKGSVMLSIDIFLFFFSWNKMLNKQTIKLPVMWCHQTASSNWWSFKRRAADVSHDLDRADSRLTPSQWETSLQCNAVSHWLGANLESALLDVML